MLTHKIENGGCEEKTRSTGVSFPDLPGNTPAAAPLFSLRLKFDKKDLGPRFRFRLLHLIRRVQVANFATNDRSFPWGGGRHHPMVPNSVRISR